MTKSVSYEKSRLKELLWMMIQIHQPCCFFCNKPFRKSEILPSRGVDQLTEHHIDGNHYNNDPSNRTLAHRTCHKRSESGKNINFWNQF